MIHWIYVFIGGGLGSVARYGVSMAVSRWAGTLPIATFLANVGASVVIGILVGGSLRGWVSDEQRLLWATGFCGGFSTFSTFSNETLALYQQGQVGLALGNVILSVVSCLIAVAWGIKIAG